MGAAKKTESDPDGGSWPAYPSGKSWDEASGKTGSGKKFYHNVIPGSAVATEPFYVALITPVIHYCMGGLETTKDGEVCKTNGQPMPGLFVRRGRRRRAREQPAGWELLARLRGLRARGRTELREVHDGRGREVPDVPGGGQGQDHLEDHFLSRERYREET